ncbi:Imm1 family immunity protein [Streptomyces sp. NBC_00582]|uniref:Imm1 family immunity protein n=1 Tax=Streptomyces sp. NBC_00582 TaxID=2975783 RepID=UPI001063F02A|nr:Imm1 family immunity protein [Streptomyces sp. NBC_00582]WUB59277.1 Imm1 family immunity protein [Streptomyces sp. NBC_00582]
MIESWAFADDTAPPSPAAAIEVLRERINASLLETWLTSSSGRSLAFISNTKRAMVMLLDGEDDPGEHAVDPGASGSSAGFVLANGQHDEYPDEDTLPLAEALQVVQHILTTGAPPPHVAWSVDR